MTHSVNQIHSASLAIEALISSRSRREFGKDRAAVREVRRHLKAIRKAAKEIPESFREQHPEVEWRRLSAVRIVFFYEYFGIDVDAIWNIFVKAIAGIEEDMGKMKNEN